MLFYVFVGNSFSYGLVNVMGSVSEFAPEGRLSIPDDSIIAGRGDLQALN
jgi:hypothetical protein